MKKGSWPIVWQSFRDVALTGFGGWIIWKQAYSEAPSGYLIFVGVALMVPSARAALVSILSEGSVPVRPPKSGGSDDSDS